MKGNRLINFALAAVTLAAVTLLWGIPHAFKPAAVQAASLEAPHWGEGGVPQFQIDPDWPKIPSKWKVGFGSAVVGDNKGNVWILSRPRRLPKEDQASAGIRRAARHGIRPGGEFHSGLGRPKRRGVSMAIERAWTLRG